jgi:hypothetical protein
MKRIMMMLALTALLVVALSLSAVTAFAANAPPGCHKDQGTIVCPDDAKNDRFDGNQQTTKKGSINSSHEEQNVCVESPCPPGQFRD